MTIPLTHRALLAPAFLPDHAESEASIEQHEEAPGEAAPGEGATATAGDEGQPAPPGLALADLLAHGLVAHGWQVSYRWTTYVGHALDARRGEQRYDVEVALLDKEADKGTGRWLVTAKRRTGFFRRLLKREVDPAEHALLRHDIDATLAADPRTAGAAATWVTEDRWEA